MPRESTPTIQSFRVRAVRVPLADPHRTASGVIGDSPLVLTDVVTDGGVTGHSVLFTYTPAALGPRAELVRNLEELVRGDALARVHGLSLVRLLGGAAKPMRPYGAVGYDGEEGSARVAEGWAKRGCAPSTAKVSNGSRNRRWPTTTRATRGSRVRRTRRFSVAGIRMSNHLWPEVSARLLCCTPTAHWLEYVDWWNPVLAEPLAIEKGMAIVDERAGSGIEWNEEAVQRFAL